MTACVICHTSEKFAFIKHGYKIFTCPSCGLYRTQLRQPYRQLLNSYYTKAYFTGSLRRAGYANYQKDHQVVRRNAQIYLQALRRHLPQKLSHPKLLDVGCATGIFVQAAQTSGFNAYGIDIAAYAVREAQKLLGSKIRRASLTTAKFAPASFNIITLIDVFEHLNQPVQSVGRLHQLLCPGGLLLINTGNTRSFLARLESHRWHYFIPPQHTYYYSDINLTHLLRTHGFKILKIYTSGKYISLRYLWHLMRTINHSSLANRLYLALHQTFIGKLTFYVNLHDNMTLVAKKI